jgi:hypothetical protein
MTDSVHAEQATDKPKASAIAAFLGDWGPALQKILKLWRRRNTGEERCEARRLEYRKSGLPDLRTSCADLG